MSHELHTLRRELHARANSGHGRRTGSHAPPPPVRNAPRRREIDCDGLSVSWLLIDRGNMMPSISAKQI